MSIVLQSSEDKVSEEEYDHEKSSESEVSVKGTVVKSRKSSQKGYDFEDDNEEFDE